jgi:hypothetical protein
VDPFRCNKPMFICHSNSLRGMPTTSWNAVNISKMAMIAEGPMKLGVQRQNPPIGSVLPRANRARDKETQGMANNWHFLGPH